MSKIEIELNSKGIGELLRSAGVESFLSSLMRSKAAGGKFYVNTSKNGSRARAFAGTRNRKNIELLRDVFR
ncbi:MAG: hypothetical protein LBS85_00070 [Clostridiales Family XIII bacterium]|jgi:restriction endonuclease Mrr|nr:hypothetical protein [Clostridiales Family XIII bacterium]